ncbi:MAG: hypothetical protein IJQ98_02160, partial [Oscillospiraceae bacterium]|nr:hypothetical protein [Oscillospiraceae bacterium]
MMKTQREGHYGKEQQGLPELRQENEAAVYRLAALQMRYELEKGRVTFNKYCKCSYIWYIFEAQDKLEFVRMTEM